MLMKIRLFAVLVAYPLISAAENQIISATYGLNCGAPGDNAKQAVEEACNDHRSCVYTVDYNVLGDPAPGCAKTFVTEWTCATGARVHSKELPSEAGLGAQLTLACGLGGIAGREVPKENETPANPESAQIVPPTLEITAISPSQPISNSSWSVHFRLINNWLARKTLTGWLEAVAYDASDSEKAHAIGAQSYPIADLQVDQVAEGDLVFSTTSSIGNGHVELTYFNISSGYSPGPRSPEGVLPDVPSAVKARLLKSGKARELSTASSDFVVIPEAQKIAVVFDFDTDSCYPSAAVSDQRVVNPGLSVNDWGITSGCRQGGQLENAKTYYRKASLGDYSVHMYALYFMKDKVAETASGHRHDWEFALVWTTNGVITHASYSAHGNVNTDSITNLDQDPDTHVKIVYHHDGGLTHAMRFAGENEQAENHLGRWLTPTLVEWDRMTEELHHIFNTHDFGAANCSFNNHNFPEEIAKSPPPGYPSGAEWAAAARNP
jgi:hypothetical protein